MNSIAKSKNLIIEWTNLPADIIASTGEKILAFADQENYDDLSKQGIENLENLFDYKSPIIPPPDLIPNITNANNVNVMIVNNLKVLAGTNTNNKKILMYAEEGQINMFEKLIINYNDASASTDKLNLVFEENAHIWGGRMKKQQKLSKSNEKIKIGNQTRVVYLGTRGGRYVKMGGNVVPVSKLNKK